MAPSSSQSLVDHWHLNPTEWLLDRLLDHAGGRLLDLPEKGEKGGRRREKGRKRRGERGEKREERSLLPTTLRYPHLLLFLSVLILSFNIEGSAVVQRLLVIQLLKRLSFTFTFATQNARKVQGNRQYRRKVISIDDEWVFRTLARHVREDVKRFGD